MATPYTANVGEDWMIPGIRILPLPSVNIFSENGWEGRDQYNFLSLEWETILEGKLHEDVERELESYLNIIFF